MDFLKWFREPTPPPIIPLRTDSEKVDFHIARFTRALEQCENSKKRADLERNLRYWLAIKAAQEGLN